MDETIFTDMTRTETQKEEGLPGLTGRKVILSFNGLEDEFEKLLKASLPCEDNGIGQIKNGILHLNLNPNLFRLVVHGAKLSKLADKIEYRIDKVSNFFKKHGAQVIEYWNERAPLTKRVKSVRIFSKDMGHAVLITVKNSFSIKKAKLVLLKPFIGEHYNKLFDENITFTIKDDEELKKIVFCALKQIFGNQCIDKFFDINVDVSTKENYEEILKTLPEEIQTQLKAVVTKISPSVQYE